MSPGPPHLLGLHCERARERHTRTTASCSAAAAAPRLRPVAPRSRSATVVGPSRVAAPAGAPSVLPVAALDRRASPAEALSSQPGPDGRRHSGLRRICSRLPTLSSPLVLPAPPLPAPVVGELGDPAAHCTATMRLLDLVCYMMSVMLQLCSVVSEFQLEDVVRQNCRTSTR